PAQPRRLTLKRPDGKPLEGAPVRPLALVPSNEPVVRFYLSVPDELGTILSSKTDREGNVELTYLGESDSALLSVSTADLGIQNFMTQPGIGKSVSLRNVGRVPGLVLPDAPAVSRGITIGLSTQ